MNDDVYEITIHDEDGAVLLHKKMTKEEAEAAIVAFDLVKDRPHMAFVRAVFAKGVYQIGQKGILAQRVRGAGEALPPPFLAH
jgi:hypothetical protein